jgi:hypothetical protein
VKDELTASRLDEQVKLAVLERAAQMLERAVERFHAAHGRDPFSLDELVVAGLVPSIPEDPFGGAYRWDPAERRVHSSANAFRFSPREGPQEGGFTKPNESELRRFPE